MKKPPAPECGEVWTAFLDPVVGHEQGGLRPALIVSNDQFNQLPHELCMIAPITRSNRNLPTQLVVQSPEGGLAHDSVIMCDQIRTISVHRLRRRRGKVDDSTRAVVQALIRRYLTS